MYKYAQFVVQSLKKFVEVEKKTKMKNWIYQFNRTTFPFSEHLKNYICGGKSKSKIGPIARIPARVGQVQVAEAAENITSFLRIYFQSYTLR